MMFLPLEHPVRVYRHTAQSVPFLVGQILLALLPYLVSVQLQCWSVQMPCLAQDKLMQTQGLPLPDGNPLAECVCAR